MNSELMILIDANIKGVSDKFKQIKDKTQALNDSLKTAAKISGAAFAGLSAGIGLVVSQAAKMETLQTQFKVLTGNTKLAERAMRDLQDFSASTPFQFEDVAKAGQKLLGFGFSVDEIQKKLRQIGDVSAAVGTNLGDLTLIIGQVAASGKLTAERFNQLQERSVMLGPAIAKAMGVAEESVRDLISQGKVTNDVFQKAFATLSEKGGIAFGGMAERSKTLSGLISTLKDNFILIAAEMGKYFLPAIKAITKWIINFVDTIRNNPAIIKFSVTMLAIGTAVAGAVAAFSTLGLGVLAVSAAFTALLPVLTGAAAIIAPIALPIVGIGLAIAGLLYKLKELSGGWDKLWLNMKATTTVVLNAITDVLGSFASLIKDILTGQWGNLKGDLKAVRDSFSEHMDIMEEIKAEKAAISLENELEQKEIKNNALLEQQAANAIKVAQAKAKEEKEKQNLDDATSFNFLGELKKRQKFEDITNAQRLQNFQSTLGQISTLSNSNNKALMAVGKSSAIAQAYMSTYSAANVALASAPPPFNFALMAGVIAAGLANVAQIVGVKLAKGGIVMPRVGGTQAIIGEGGKKEAVIPLDDPRTEEIMGGYGLGGGSGKMDVNLNFTGDLARYIEEKQVENERLRISIQRA